MSRAEFEKWFTANDSAVMAKRSLERDGDGYKFMIAHSAWLVWQAAESHTARECVEWHERQAEVAGRADNTEEARLHMAHAKHFRAAYPDAFKEGQ